MTEPTDAALIRQSQAGESGAFSRLVTRHWARVRRVLLAAGVQADEVEDVLQEAFLQAYLSLDSLRDPEKFYAWVCGIGLNLARMGWRKRPFIPISWERLSKTAVADHAPSPEQQTERRLRLARLNAAIADLPPAEREALLLVYRDGLTHRETADLLGASLSAVKVRVHRGRRRLQIRLQAGRPAPRARQPAREEQMIPVTVVDVLSHVLDASKFGIDRRQLFAGALDAIPAAQQESALSGLSLSINLGAHYWEKVIMPLADDVRQTVMKELGQFLPHRVVLLQEQDGARVLPIWIGPFEADLIALTLARRDTLRPLTNDLTKTLLELSGTQIEKGAVSKLHEGVYYGTLSVTTPQETAEIDCRPSDALVLATRMDVPFFVAPQVMDAQSVPAAHFTRQEDGRYQVQHKPMQEGEWQSMVVAG